MDDDRVSVELLAAGLGELGFAVEIASPFHALELLGDGGIDALITELTLAEMPGLDLCEHAHTLQPGLPVVVLTAFASLETAIEAIRAGAYDFLPKPVDIHEAAHALERAVESTRVQSDLIRLEEAVDPGDELGPLLGESRVMHDLVDLVKRVRDSDVTVLVTGESGTGKELVARTLHRSGKRGTGPFVAINCAALSPQLLESELFGHAKGAFTDARADHIGLFVQAQGGTLFLDEVAEMPAGMQAKLLRALQDHRVRPVGSDREVSFDARIVAATNRDLGAAVESREFRQDLYFRLNVLEIRLPPLRERGKDVLALARRFIKECSESGGKRVLGITPDAAQRLFNYAWPGNVRELRNYMERAVALARYDQITVDDLPSRLRTVSGFGVVDPDELVTLDEIARRYVLRVLTALGGRRSAAAKVLGVDRKTLYRKLDRWGYGGG